ncbi:hypothetical protein BRADI_4g20955v3 [Brachypodium distachyon]|uniref:DNA-directed RNA polymerase RpoA/D/Rpb3-type domain-containing protein n=1 Tax=Brachypodium distachyon TaxID=15368 RepID=A0A0Q3IR74_BRADI|nr:hypothetical protein BRADI_4g20955v3 [Brachypodium distachyon]
MRHPLRLERKRNQVIKSYARSGGVKGELITGRHFGRIRDVWIKKPGRERRKGRWQNERLSFLDKVLRNGNEKHEILFLKIWTNGSLTPKKALYEASRNLIDLFLPFLRAEGRGNWFQRK